MHLRGENKNRAHKRRSRQSDNSINVAATMSRVENNLSASQLALGMYDLCIAQPQKTASIHSCDPEVTNFLLESGLDDWFTAEKVTYNNTTYDNKGTMSYPCS